ncbi:MAG: hypothetical protein E8D45_08700 [Nitrospira sp.]|nr:MAG: hypothetical protein E8D45_08700 [Nitrospira sp.]
MKTKTFDCVEMKHRGAEQVKEKIDRLTVPQELAFWAERSAELKKHQALAKHEAARLNTASHNTGA